MKILEEAKLINDETIKNRRYLHAFPEVGLEIPKTAKFVFEALVSYGYSPSYVGHGVVANIGKKNKKTILLRADMDALPMDEFNDLDFKSENQGAAHTCGHDLHTAMLLSTAKLLKKYEDSLEGNVKLMFQPDEEGLTGAQNMIDHGLLENPKVDAAMAMHVFPSLAKTGLLTIKKGAWAAGAARFKIVIKGIGGHGAHPEETIDPIFIAMQIYQSLNVLKTREIKAIDPFVLTIGKLVAGEAPNIIPEFATIEGSIRFFSQEVGNLAIKRIEEIAIKTAELFNGSCVVEFLGACPPVINDELLSTQIIEILQNNELEVLELNDVLMGSEDFSFIANKVPSAYFGLGAGLKEDGYAYMCHHPNVLFDENTMPYGISAFVSSAIEWLKIK